MNNNPQQLALEILLQETKGLKGEELGMVISTFSDAYNEHKEKYGSFKKHIGTDQYDQRMMERAQYQLKEARKMMYVLRLKGYK